MLDGYSEAQSKPEDYQLTIKSNADKMARFSSANDIKNYFRLSDKLS